MEYCQVFSRMRGKQAQVWHKGGGKTREKQGTALLDIFLLLEVNLGKFLPLLSQVDRAGGNLG